MSPYQFVLALVLGALAPTGGGDVQGSARKDVVFGAARVYTFTVPGPKWKSWLQFCFLGKEEQWC